MATNTYVALDKVTVGTAVSSITLSSINQGYTDLVVVVNAKTATDNDGYYVQFNNDTSTNYSVTALIGNGTTSVSVRESSASRILVGFNSSSSSSDVVNISVQNYANTTTYKTLLSRLASPARATAANVGLWRSTAAITSITIGGSTSNIQAGSTFSLYGIAAASVGAKATGGTIYSDADYFYHVFRASGTFTPAQSISADCLVVAGGGGGGYYYGAGGGAGGVQWATSQSLTATGYTVTVGAGGPSRSGSSAGNGTVGVDSSFSSLVIAKGGGYGAGSSSTAVAGGSGGSGGGAGGGGTGSVSGGSAVAGTGGTHYGNAGGGGSVSGTAGGGGAGGVGGARASSTPANGGVGLSGATLPALNVIGAATGIGVLSSGNYYIAGGGADSNNSASAGGLGGGGNWNASGIDNTGGGAGGDQNGGGGGSGIVIVRYAKV